MLISQQGRRFRSSAAFSLIEIVIVIAIVAVIMGMALPRLGGRNYQIRSQMRRVALLSEQVRGLAKLERSTYRLVIQMNNENTTKPVNQYWFEKAPGRALLPSADEMQNRAETGEGDEGEPSGGEFQPSRMGGEPKDLPAGLIFDSVEVHGFDEEFRLGRVYVYYSMQGLVQEAAIHFKVGEELEWTLALHPLTGRGELQAGHISLEELQDR